MINTHELSRNPTSEFFKFCEGLRGYDIYYNGHKLFKWQVFHMTNSKEIRESISKRQNPNFKYHERDGWNAGHPVVTYGDFLNSPR